MLLKDEPVHKPMVFYVMDRIDQLQRLLNDGAELSTEEISQSLGCTGRHVRRLIKELGEKLGAPLIEMRDGHTKRFSIPEEYRHTQFQDFEFDQEEMLALSVAAEAAKSGLKATSLEAPLKRAFDKLLETLIPEAYTFEVENQPDQWHFDSSTINHVDPAIFQALQKAITENQRVRIDYHTASTGKHSASRKVDPLLFALKRNSWLLVAYCHARQGLRDFSLSGITDVMPCKDEFFLRGDFDPNTYFQDRFGAMAGGKMHQVRLLIEPDRAAYFERKDYHHSQQIEEHRSDGSLVVSYEVIGLPEIRSFAQSWGVGVTVLEPPELVAIMAEEAKVLAARYG